MKLEIPQEVKKVTSALESAGFEAFVVGGCVRDLLLANPPAGGPKDWDIATQATPEEIQKLFPDNFYENNFFTVTVLTGSDNPKLKEVEVTTYRSDHKYTDRRRPEEVKYAETLQEDLSRRDFTVNAIAFGADKLIDPFEGQKDIQKKTIRAVGKPEERFSEDALRMIRGARLATQLNFSIEEKTKKAIQEHSALLKEISAERIRDEFVKTIMAKNAMEGVELLYELKLLQYIIPELEEGYGIDQNKHHTYTVWEHNLRSLDYTARQDWSLEVRLSALLHDVAKPRVKRGEGPNATFYNHEVESASMARRTLSKLKFPKAQIELIAKLIRYHMFYYNTDEVTESSIRRLIRKMGQENIKNLLQLRMADRIGSGVPKAQPYRLRHWQYMIEKVSKDAISPKMLKISGSDVMEILGVPPGPKIGFILTILLAQAIEEPRNNTQDYLISQVRELGELEEGRLKSLAVKAKQEVDQVETEKDEAVKQKHWVK